MSFSLFSTLKEGNRTLFSSWLGHVYFWKTSLCFRRSLQKEELISLLLSSVFPRQDLDLPWHQISLAKTLMEQISMNPLEIGGLTNTDTEACL